MARLEMTVELDRKSKKEVKAEKVLALAREGLALLRAIERGLVTGKRCSVIPWIVEITSSYSRVLIVYRCESEAAGGLDAQVAEGYAASRKQEVNDGTR